MKDFIIVGRGLAATCLMHQFHKAGISFITIGNTNLSSSSRVAAGIWNPIVFKRLTSSWMADKLIPKLENFYHDCEIKINKKILYHRNIQKPFTEDQEKNLWKKKANDELSAFLDPHIYSASSNQQHLKIANQFGQVKQAGNVDMLSFLDASTGFFADCIVNEIFVYENLKIEENKVCYNNHHAKNIVFCEGYLVKHNPVFSWIPLVPAQGETLTIKSKDLLLQNSIFNRDGFIMDIAPHLYKVGATYEWKNLNDQITDAGLFCLQKKLSGMIDCDYDIVSHEAGVRPSSLDRRPIVGAHPKHQHAFVFNGLGSKGVMLAPFFTENFVHFYLQKQTLHPEVDVKRFYHLYESST